MVCRLRCGIGGCLFGFVIRRRMGKGKEEVWEMQRRDWRGIGRERYGNKFKFAAMAEKIEMLCEGISYLLFQQLVGG